MNSSRNLGEAFGRRWKTDYRETNRSGRASRFLVPLQSYSDRTMSVAAYENAAFMADLSSWCFGDGFP